MTQVDWPIRVGRAIVQDVDWRPAADPSNGVIDLQLLPFRQYFGLVLRQIGLHWEGGLGQVDGGLQIERPSLVFSQIIDFLHYRELISERPFMRCAPSC